MSAEALRPPESEEREPETRLRDETRLTLSVFCRKLKKLTTKKGTWHKVTMTNTPKTFFFIYFYLWITMLSQLF